MKRTFVAAALMIVTAQSTMMAGLAQATPQADTMQRDADALLVQGAPGVLAELDTPRGEIKVRSGVGNTTTGTPVPWDAKFRIGSYTKTFVATTLLQLVGEGKLSLEDPVAKWLPGVVTGNGNDGRAITVRQLLQHTSGLPEFINGMTDMFEQEGFLRERFTSFEPEQLVELAMRQEPQFAPGTSWAYSNTNYILAGMVIESVTGNEWAQETRERIIEPLGLHDTYIPGEFPFLPAPHAVGYERFPDDMTSPNPTYGPQIDATALNPSWAGAAGEIISTTEDGNRFLQALMRGEVLRPAELAEMKKTVRAEMFDVVWPGARYGLGLMWSPNECGGFWSHGGDIPGFMTRNGVTEDGSRSVMVTINTDSMLPEEGAPPVTGDHAADLVENALCGTR
ncbi:serine hydrolase domain-containing protein [Saccharopolyspora sp. CA-218241]|uniref:serine hydrolase domain-containing protein n=1 Tax=Saccharopolyspora sp. CA-218241 TaxID=3240027 RepID=UPI003D9796F8